MDSVRFLLLLRLRTASRAAAGLFRAEPLSSLFVLAVLAAAGAYTYAQVQTVQGGTAIAALAMGLVWMVHAQRNDLRFLRIAGVPYRVLYAAEFLLLLLPVVVLLLVSAEPRLALLPVLGAVLMAATPPGLIRGLGERRRSRPPVRLPLPPLSFEWAAGLRRSAVGILLTYGAAALLSRLPAVPLLALVILTGTACAFFLEAAEGWQMVEAAGRSPQPFLHRKIRQSAALFGLLTLPVAAAFLLRHPERALVLGVVWASCAVIHAGSILLKYALYRPGWRPSVWGSIGLLVLAASLAVPPVAAFLLWRLWRQSVRNLEPYACG